MTNLQTKIMAIRKDRSMYEVRTHVVVTRIIQRQQRERICDGFNHIERVCYSRYVPPPVVFEIRMFGGIFVLYKPYDLIQGDSEHIAHQGDHQTECERGRWGFESATHATIPHTHGTTYNMSDVIGS